MDIVGISSASFPLLKPVRGPWRTYPCLCYTDVDVIAQEGVWLICCLSGQSLFSGEPKPEDWPGGNGLKREIGRFYE